MIEYTTWFIFAYFILLNAGYLALNFLSIFALQRTKQDKLMEDMPQVFSGREPSISILVPAYNEEATITASIRCCSTSTHRPPIRTCVRWFVVE